MTFDKLTGIFTAPFDQGRYFFFFTGTSVNLEPNSGSVNAVYINVTEKKSGTTSYRRFYNYETYGPGLNPQGSQAFTFQTSFSLNAGDTVQLVNQGRIIAIVEYPIEFWYSILVIHNFSILRNM